MLFLQRLRRAASDRFCSAKRPDLGSAAGNKPSRMMAVMDDVVSARLKDDLCAGADSYPIGVTSWK